ncbi:MAG: M28 family peptidase, partial [Nanoarchaeota archaeon]
MVDIKLIERLIDAHGVSGNEEEVRTIIRREIEKYVDETYVDKFGNLIAHKKGKPPRVMLASHMDEVGLIVRNITDKGNLYVSVIGGLDPVAMIGQRVVINAKEKIYGVVSNANLSDGIRVEELPRTKELFVYTGLSKDKLKKIGIEIGSYVDFISVYPLCCGDVVFGKALDDRIGCYILIELIKRLKNAKNEIYFVFTVQEEIGLFGARTSAYQVEPAWAIVIDVTSTDDVTNVANPTKVLGN